MTPATRWHCVPFLSSGAVSFLLSAYSATEISQSDNIDYVKLKRVPVRVKAWPSADGRSAARTAEGKFEVIAP